MKAFMDEKFLRQQLFFQHSLHDALQKHGAEEARALKVLPEQSSLDCSRGQVQPCAMPMFKSDVQYQSPSSAAQGQVAFEDCIAPSSAQKSKTKTTSIQSGLSPEAIQLVQLQERTDEYRLEASDAMKIPLLGEADHHDPLLRAATMSADAKRAAQVRMDTLFPKVEDIKCSVSESLRKELYDVEDYYHDSGFWQALARSDYFKTALLVVIAVNTVWIAVETDYNKADILCDAPWLFIICDNAFCTIFTFEILVRFMAFKRKVDSLMDSWFLFDSTLVFLMVWETWIIVLYFLLVGTGLAPGSAAKNSQVFRMLRLVRLVRVARTTRLLQSCPELLILARGMVAGIRSVIAVLCLLFMIVYVFAVTFTMCLAGTEMGNGIFDTVPMSMNSLLLTVLCGAQTHFMQSLLAAGWMYYAIYLAFLLVAVLTLMNMLIGILCDVVSEAAEDSKEELLMKEVKSEVTRLANELDMDGDGGISKDEFDLIVKDTKMCQSFCALGVDVVGIANFGKFIYNQADGDEDMTMSYGDFGNLVCQFRGKKLASVQDVMDMRRYVTMELKNLREDIKLGLQDDATDTNASPQGPPSMNLGFGGRRPSFSLQRSSSNRDAGGVDV
jgi:hypothetical protein